MTYTSDEIMAIAKDTSLSADGSLEKIVQIGLDELELTLGIVSQIINTTYTVIYTNNPDLLGQVFDLGVTYCSITLNLETTKVFAANHFSVSENFRHPAHEAFQLETYIGTPIVIDDKHFGTLNLTQPTPRTKLFTEDEKLLMQWLAEAIAYILENREHSLNIK